MEALSPSPSAGALRSRKSVTLRLRVPFPTRWGENLVLCGDDERLGAWEPSRGTWMQCLHVGDLLVWQARGGVRCAGLEARLTQVHHRRWLRCTECPLSATATW